MEDSLQRRWAELLQTAGDSPAIGWYDRRRNVEWLSRGDLHTRAAGVGCRLVADGVKAGDPVVIVLPSTLEAAIHVIGVHLVGAVPLLVAPPSILGENSNLREVVSDVIRRSRAAAVIAASDVDIDTEAAQFRLYREVVPAAATIDETLLVTPGSDAIGGLQLTSGTTGFPRICVWRQKGILAALDGMAAAMQLQDDDICLNWTPLYHDMGLVNNLLLCYTAGVPVVMMSPHDFVRRPALWLQALSDTGATVSWSPNFGFALTASRVRDSELDGVDLTHVRSLWNAAERIHADTIRAFDERFRGLGLGESALRTNFGCAENVGGATFSDPRPVTIERLDTTRFQQERVAVPAADPRAGTDVTTIVSAGRPFPGMQIRILSEDHEPLSDGEIGLIALDSPSALDEYLGDEEATNAAKVDGAVITGDLGYVRDSELFWVGRARERINVRGKKLDPSDFETVLLGVEGVRPGCFAAFGIDDPALGTERVVIVSEIRDGQAPVDGELAGAIRERVFSHLGVHVDEILLVEEGTLTKTSSGKRRHVHFRKLHEDNQLDPFIVSRHS